MSQPPDASRASSVEQRNFRLNAAEGALFISSGALVSPQTVLPALVARLGGGSIAVGALVVVVNVGLFLPQLFAARYVETLPRKKPWTVTFGLVHRILLLLISVALLLFGGSNVALVLALFFILYSLVQMMMGVTTPGWYDLFAKLTPVGRRGRLVGIRNSLGGAGAFLCGIVLTWLLDAVPFPGNYAWAIFLAFALQMASVAVQERLSETELSPTVMRKPIFLYIRTLPQVLRTNSDFRKFIIASIFLVLAAMPVGFYTVYALKRFRADESVIGAFTLSIVSIQVVSALVNGYIADRYGNKTALICAAAGLLCASVCALLAPTLGWFMVVYPLLGINLGTELMARYNMSVEYGQPQHRSTYIGLMNTVLAPFYLSGVIGGIIVDAFGYAAVFGTGIAFSLTGLILLLRWVKEPRFLRAAAPG